MQSSVKASVRVALMVLLRMALLGVLAASCGAMFNLVRRDSLPWKGEWSKHVEKRALHADLKVAGLSTMRQAVATGAPLVLDARPAAAFRKGHIPGARSLPLDVSGDVFAAGQIELASDQLIITYCTRSDCDESLELALLLRHAGYANIAVFVGGLAEWLAAGGALEVEK